MNLEQVRQTRRARDLFFSGESIVSQWVPEPITRSWERSRRLGLSASDKRLFDMAAPGERRIATERGERLIRYAMPEMTRLYKAFHTQDWVLACLDVSGFVICSIGDAEGPCRELESLFRNGVSLSESAIGTGAPGCALVEQKPFIVHANEHFLDEIHGYSCAAVPLFDVNGDLIGVLNATCRSGRDLSSVCEALRVAARAIENHMLLDLPGALHVSLHYHPDLLRTPLAAVLAFSEHGQLLGGNQIARKLLGHTRSATEFDHMFDLPFARAVDELSGRNAEPIVTDTPAGIRVHLSLARHADDVMRVGKALLPPPSGKRSSHASSDMFCSDPALLDTIGDAKLAFARYIPVLLTGETGTGKEVLARELHASGPRRNGPFVPVNCASIPDGLIEAELFGYVEGAFTGARRGGAPGKFEQAHGGTLFLDEIGDMPLSLQARLLRVLQERAVMPVGGSKDRPIDISLVCATHRDLKALVATGEFREDLYYRIDGLCVTLPPLRERADLSELIGQIVDREIGDRLTLSLSDDALECLRSFAWPGNIRQLSLILRRAIALAAGSALIAPRHLPEEMRQTRSNVGREVASLERTERDAVLMALHQCAGNIAATARQLGVGRPTLYRKMRKYNIEVQGVKTIF